MHKWLQTLNLDHGGSPLSLSRNVGKGFFFLESEDKDVLDKALMLSHFKSKWGTCMLQSWIPCFNPYNPSNLAFPTWVTLRRLPYELFDQAIAIAETLGEVIGIDTANGTAKDPRFCVNLKVNEGWVTSIDLEDEGGISTLQKVSVDYDKLPMRCKVCQRWKHKIKDYKEIQKRHVQGVRRQTHAHLAQQPEKGKNISLDQDGFL